MSEESQEAKALAKRAGAQAKHAGKNTGRAARAAAEAGAEVVADEAHEAVETVEGTAEAAAHAARRVNVGVLTRMSGDTGIGFLALTVAIYSGTVAYMKFRQAWSGGSQVIS